VQDSQTALLRLACWPRVGPLDVRVRISDNDRMREPDASERLARRAALFGPASGRHRAVQPIPRQGPGTRAFNSQDESAIAAAVRAADCAVLRSGSVAQIELQVLAILAASRQRTMAELASGEVSVDGSLAIDSMSAVFVCRIVGRVLGPRGLSRLRGKCDPRDFVSVHSVAMLIARLRRGVAVA
jgi:hypothetical protein